ncbi:MAG: DNA mismatch repair protein MutL, partial [Bacteroidetes bacterium]
FRGEALASIAAVAQVRLRTRRQGEEVGVELDVEASEIRRQQPAACPPGSSFLVRNLFYNVPARRNFLKSNPVEARHILNEFVRVALAWPERHFTLTHQSTPVYDLPPGTIAERMVSLFGDDLRGKLIRVEEATGYGKISGWIADPSVSRKSRGDQYFFVNGRFIRSHYLHHAVMGCYEGFLPRDTYPVYALFLELDPVHVDINIHPTKTEVKFDDERTLYVLLQAALKRGLSEAHQAPLPDQELNPVQRRIYDSGRLGAPSTRHSSPQISVPLPPQSQPRQVDWDALYKPVEPANRPETPVSPTLFGREKKAPRRESGAREVLIQWQERYILTNQDDDLLVIDQRLAHQRILFERFLKAGQGQGLACQQLLFPQTLGFPPADYLALREVDALLTRMGFEIKEFGKDTLIVYGTPSGIATGKVRGIFEQILADVKTTGTSQALEQQMEHIARAIALRSAVTSPHKLSMLEMKNMINDLFACEVPGYAPQGKPTYYRLPQADLGRFFGETGR